ncbi:SRPBCC family protein [Streptomyces sp. ITFR-16]|uniref:SRPBCC family protein n=1 Tax=Streptomyces sp. ITFR-16 TaxID=3075198 RepID=UPI00288B540B|nr:SRPBCC family protein [Streptomyces sp. ITFR-16]WNI27248.1 SRPBCC family protein [Streptomyces sp. ITFR-16]
MSAERGHSTQRTMSVAAPAGVVYGMLADAVRWPVFLPSLLHVERMDFDGVEEQLRVWDLTDGHVRSSHLRRTLDPRTRSIGFEQRTGDRADAPVTGRWSVEPEDEGSTLTLRQDGASASHDVPERLRQVKETAERWERLDELLVGFEDSVHVEGPSELVYDFLYRMEDWVELIPHVEWTLVREDQPGVQLAAMDTCAEDSGETVTVETVRLCFPHAGRIVYKETLTPDPIASHSGEWSLLPDESGVKVVSTHQVMLREEAIGRALGEQATPADARHHVRTWLGRASTEALGLAKWHAESAVRRLR